MFQLFKKKEKTSTVSETLSVYAEAVGRGGGINYQGGGYYGTECIRWVSREADAEEKPRYTRIPRQTVTDYPYPGVFRAAGKTYTSRNHLCAKMDDDRVWCTDIYGRRFVCIRERFPCFDSYDYAHENRYYYWYFLREGDRLTRIYYADDGGSITVTEDVRELEYKCLRELRELGFLE